MKQQERNQKSEQGSGRWIDSYKIVKMYVGNILPGRYRAEIKFL